MAALCISVLALAGCGDSFDATVPLTRMDVESLVTPCDYMNLGMEFPEVTVDEEEAAALLNNLYIQFIDPEDGITDRAVVEGDTVLIDYVGKKDGVAFQGGTASNASLGIGSDTYIDGFEDGLIGVMPGETVDLDLTFPENYGNTELAGQAVVFTVTVNCIMPTEVDESKMRDSVIADMGIDGVETVAQLKDFIHEYLYQTNLATTQQSLYSTISDAVIERSVYQKLPKSLVEKYREQYAKDITQEAANRGVTVDGYCDYYYQMTYEEMLETIPEKAAKQDLVFQAIANKEGISTSDTELDAELLSYANAAGYSTIEQYLGDISKEEFRNYLNRQKVLSKITEDMLEKSGQ